jgi:hypothetical protein
MEEQNDQVKCQICCIPNYFEGYATIPPESFKRKLRLLIRRNMNSTQVRLFKSKTGKYINKISNIISPNKEIMTNMVSEDKPKINAGDLVRVRSEAEIRATLNNWGQLKGCMVMPDMLPYCGTVQRVFKRLERFVDEKDYYVKKSNGIILLEGLYCQGTSDYGRCDRSCFYFWREEWLEKIDNDNNETTNLK